MAATVAPTASGGITVARLQGKNANQTSKYRVERIGFQLEGMFEHKAGCRDTFLQWTASGRRRHQEREREIVK